jgi:hypothetical protein
MSLCNNTPALHPREQALHVRETNVDSTASATVVVIVGTARRLACALQMHCRCSVHSMACQRALVLQGNDTRPAAEAPFVQQGSHHATVSFCSDRSTAPRNGDVGRHSHQGEESRAGDAVTGRRYHSTVDGKIKGREVRPGRVREDHSHIRHFARGATSHDSLRNRTTHWNIGTTRTSRAAPR